MKKLKYNLKFYLDLIKDEESVNFHTQENDYFGTIATVINLIAQEENLSYKNKKILKNLSQDFLYLQDNYKIIKKTN